METDGLHQIKEWFALFMPILIKWIDRHPERFTPFAFPITVDRLRERLSSEKLVDRVKRMQIQLEKYV